MIGLKDLEVVKDGSDNKHYGHMIKAFFLGLMRQRTHHDLANEKGLHLVEVWPENGFRLLASPEETKIKTKEQLDPNDPLDFGLVSTTVAQLIVIVKSLRTAHAHRCLP